MARDDFISRGLAKMGFKPKDEADEEEEDTEDEEPEDEKA
jgi:hypothetical protein